MHQMNTIILSESTRVSTSEIKRADPARASIHTVDLSGGLGNSFTLHVETGDIARGLVTLLKASIELERTRKIAESEDS
jgi:hypothetical protein